MPMPIPNGVADAAALPKPRRQGSCYRLCSANIGDRQPRLSGVGVRYQRDWAGAREPDRLLVLAAGDASGAREGALE